MRVETVFELFFGKGTWSAATEFYQLLGLYKTHGLEEYLKTLPAQRVSREDEKQLRSDGEHSSVSRAQGSETAARIIETYLCPSPEAAESRLAAKIAAEWSNPPPLTVFQLFCES